MLNNKKIAIYLSTHNHYSLSDTILKSLEPFDCEITLFIDPRLNKQYEVDNRISKIEFISQKTIIAKSQVMLLNQQDFVIIDELYSFKELFSFSVFNISSNKIMVIHDCNTWFNPVKPKGLKNYLKYIFTGIVKRKFKVFAVAGSNMKRYMEQNYPRTNTYLIPFRYADFNKATDLSPVYNAGEKIRICVPGTVSQRRNYDQMLDNICMPALKGKIELDVLGQKSGAYGEKIINRIAKLQREGFDIIYYKDYIDNDTFDESIRKAHLILSDFEPDYFTDNGQKEIYGITKETGVAVIMLNKAKVGLLPASFNQMEEIMDQTLFYNDTADLVNLLLSIYNGTFLNFAQLQSNAFANAAKMDISLVSNEIQAAYQRLLI